MAQPSNFLQNKGDFVFILDNNISWSGIIIWDTGGKSGSSQKRCSVK